VTDSRGGGVEGPQDYAAELGMALLRYRLCSGLSLRGLAHRLGMSGHGGLGEYEKGRRIPPADLLEAWVRALDVPLDELAVLHAKALAQRAGRKVQDRRAAQGDGVVPFASRAPALATRLAQLPPDVADFTGRAGELGWLRGLAARCGRTAGPVAVVWGEPGIGKTTLAVRFGHLAAADFPDGQLYVNLRGARDPVDPARVLSGTLRLLGVTGSMLPRGLDERAALYRSLLAGLRVLVLLDDAATEAQVRPLLPGEAGCFTIVTSRAAMSGLAGGQRVRLQPLPAEEAGELFTKIAGTSRAGEDRDACARLVRLCGYLPLAVRIAANRLANWPEWPLRFFADRLEDERSRLTELACGDLAVRGAFLASYQALDRDARWVFRCLGNVLGVDFGAEVVAILTGRPTPDAAAVLERMACLGLLQAGHGPGRYRLHDLLKIFAAEQAEQDDSEAVRRAAVRRMTGWLLATAAAAADRLASTARPPDVPGPFAGRDSALDWLDAEWPAVLAAARLASGQGLEPELFAALDSTAWYFDWRCRWEPLAEMARHACDAALRDHLPCEQVLALNTLGRALCGMERYGEAAATFRRAVDVARRAGDRRGEGIAWDRLGLALSGRGQSTVADQARQRAVEIFRALGHDRDAAFVLTHIGGSLRMRGPGSAQPGAATATAAGSSSLDQSSARCVSKPGTTVPTGRSL
jgi:transcriptional regulator with XRE-family HTH domain/tetratricopeptide (TPR) repeat protein